MPYPFSTQTTAPSPIKFSEGEDQIRFIAMPDDEDLPKDDPTARPEELPILPLKNTVLFPGVVLPITVGRASSLKLLRDAYENGRMLGVCTQRDDDVENPKAKDLFPVGVQARILKRVRMPDGKYNILLQGRSRFEVKKITQKDPYFKAEVTHKDDLFDAKDPLLKAMEKAVKEAAFTIMKLNPEIPEEAKVAVQNITSPLFLFHFIASNLSISPPDKQEILEEDELKDRALGLLRHMQREVQLLELKTDIQNRTSSDLDSQQREYFLRQQLRVLQDELGEGEGSDHERLLKTFREKEENFPETAKEQFKREYRRLQRLNPGMPDYGMTLAYLEFFLDLPWGEKTEDKLDLKEAQKVLDRDHFGLEKVKKRIVEYLAVLQLTKSLKGPILCLYGPPGVGKTSLGRSIADSLGREYIRMSLGGLHDESEIRGHRKTYIGAMAGRVLQHLKKAKSSNPVFILDEIDKIGRDFRGDPAAALLEVLDPEQNNEFTDNYLETPFDLSDVFFIATANTLDTIHPALRDRMEIIEINGYTVEEKMQIAKKYLIPKQREVHGLNGKDFTMPKGGLQHLIEGYTRESGVRNLEQKIASVARQVAKAVATGEKYQKSITAKEVERLLGRPRFDHEERPDPQVAGVAAGLAWTPFGGEILHIEATLVPGKGKFTLSGQLGDVMRESGQAALSYLRSQADTLKLDGRLFEKYDLHMHIPAGAVPKDGPSAGITMLTAMASAYTQRKIKNPLAMTGEITLTGRVLPVGGIKEKILAAKRAGIKDLILSEKNQKDIEEIGDEYIKGMHFNYVKKADEVLNLALLKTKISKPQQFKLD